MSKRERGDECRICCSVVPNHVVRWHASSVHLASLSNKGGVMYVIVRRNTRRHKHGKPYMLTRTYDTLDAALLAALELSMSGLRFEYRIVGM